MTVHAQSNDCSVESRPHLSRGSRSDALEHPSSRVHVVADGGSVRHSLRVEMCGSRCGMRRGTRASSDGVRNRVAHAGGDAELALARMRQRVTDESTRKNSSNAKRKRPVSLQKRKTTTLKSLDRDFTNPRRTRPILPSGHAKGISSCRPRASALLFPSPKTLSHRQVADEFGGVVPELPEEDRLASLLEEQQRVEHVEQVGGRLVDGADHGAPRGRHLADGVHHHLGRRCTTGRRKRKRHEEGNRSKGWL